MTPVIRIIFPAILSGLLALTDLWADGYQISTNIGPFSGCNTITVTNGLLGGGSDITNVVVGGTGTANIIDQGTNWVQFVMPSHAAGTVDIVIQSASVGNTTLSGAYTYNPRGRIFPNIPVGWSEFVGLPRSMSGSVAGELNGAAHIAGGNNYTNTFRLDDNVWTQLSGLPEELHAAAGAVWSNELYSIGGYGNTVLTNVFVFNGTTWREAPGIPAQRQLPGAAVLHGSLYAVGGLPDTHSTGQTNVWRFDVTNWHEVTGLPAGRWNLQCATLNDRLYAIGGQHNYQVWTNVFVFDGTNWTETAGLPAPLYYFTAAAMDGYIYMAGGYTGSYVTVSNAYRFDGTNWTEISGIPQKRAAGDCATLDGTFYYMGGGATNVYTYRPDTPLTGIAPVSGSVTGGYQVVIAGTNLSDGADITNVTLCGVSATIVAIYGSTQIVVTAGAGASGLGDVRVYSVSYGETSRSNGFSYNGPGMQALSSNNAEIASGETASSAKGTDFGMLKLGQARTNVFAITNSGNMDLTIGGWITNGDGAAVFQVLGMPSVVSEGTCSNFYVVFNPSEIGSHTCVVSVANDSASNPYLLNFKGASFQTTTNNGPAAGGNYLTITNGMLGSGSDITNVLVDGVSATIVAQGGNWVRIILPAHAAGTVDIVIQSESIGSMTLPGAYTYNPAGQIGWWEPGIWEEVAGLPSARGTPAVTYGNAIYALSRCDASVASNVYRFDGTNWMEEGGLPVALRFNSAAVLDGSLYSVGGNASSGAITNVYKFTPGYSVFGVSPSNGACAGGYEVTIAGLNLGNGGDITNVTLCGANVSSIVRQSSTQVVVVAGTSAFGIGDVRVYSISYGEAVKSNAFAYMADQTITFPEISDQTVTSVLHLSATASSGLPVSFTNLSGNPVNWRNTTTLTFSAIGTVSIVASQGGNTNWNPAPNVTNTFNVLPGPIPWRDGWLAIDVTPENGSWGLSAPAGYSNQMSGTGSLAAVNAVTGLYSLTWGSLSGYVAPSNLSGFVTAGSTTIFSAVYLQISTNIGTPSGVNATEGTYTG